MQAIGWQINHNNVLLALKQEYPKFVAIANHFSHCLEQSSNEAHATSARELNQLVQSVEHSQADLVAVLHAGVGFSTTVTANKDANKPTLDKPRMCLPINNAIQRNWHASRAQDTWVCLPRCFGKHCSRAMRLWQRCLLRYQLHTNKLQ